MYTARQRGCFRIERPCSQISPSARRISRKIFQADWRCACATLDEQFVNDFREAQHCHARRLTDFRSCSASYRLKSHFPTGRHSRLVWLRWTSPSMHRPSRRACHFGFRQFFCSSPPPLDMSGATSGIRCLDCASEPRSPLHSTLRASLPRIVGQP